MYFFEFTKDLSVDNEYFFVTLTSLINNDRISRIYIEKADGIRWGYYWYDSIPDLPHEVQNLGKLSVANIELPESFYISRKLYMSERSVGISGKTLDKCEDFPIEELVRNQEHFKLTIAVDLQQRPPVSIQGSLVSINLITDNAKVARTIASWFDGRVAKERRDMLVLRSELPYLLRPPVSSETYNRQGLFRASTSINSAFKQDPNLFTKHCLICGQTGFGKTNTAKMFIRQVLESKQPPKVLLIDFKEEYQDIASRFDFPYLHLSDPYEINPLDINPFMPGDNVSLINHLELLSTIFSVSGFTAAGPLLPEYMKQVQYAFFMWFWDISEDIFGALLFHKGSFLKKNNYRFYTPKTTMPFVFAKFWEDFREIKFDRLFSNSPGKNLADIKSTISARINGLKYSYINNFSYDESSKSFDKILEGSYAFSLKDVADNQTTFLLSMLILLTAASARTRKNTGTLKNLVLIEEAHLIMKRSVQSAEILDASQVLSDQFDRILAELRSKGVGLLIIDQSPSKLIRGVLANTATKVTHRLALREDLEDMYSALGLQESIGVQNLEVGWCYHKIESQPIRSEIVSLWNS